MKRIFTIVLLSTLCFFSCESDCEPGPAAACADTVPVDEACQAYFQRWFFSTQSGNCTLVAYSGCSQKGFATEAECEACQCQ